MQLVFRPIRVIGFAEMTSWVLKIGEEDKEALEKIDKRKTAKNPFDNH